MTTARDKRLDDLSTALEEWYKAEKKRIEDEVEFIDSVAKGRGATTKLANTNSEQAGLLASADITAFLSS